MLACCFTCVPLVASLADLATGFGSRRPGRGRHRPARARSQLLGQDLDHGPGAAILSGPASLLEPAMTTTRLLGQGPRGMLGLVAPHDHGEVSTDSRAGMRSATAVPGDVREQL